MKYLLLTSLLFTGLMFGDNKPWHIFIYMEAGSFLHGPALKNINAIAAHKPDNVTIHILFHFFGPTAWLYRIERNHILQCAELTLADNVSDTILHALHLVVHDPAATQHAVILWNHGFGILEPFYNEEIDSFQLHPDDPETLACQMFKRCIRESEHRNHKGMLYNEYTNSCMKNDELITMLAGMREILGKPIDILGLDMCKGAMIEHAYQFRKYVHYLIGSQECELTDGWPYAQIMHTLSVEPTITPELLVCSIISAYDRYYQAHATKGIYTQSALDLAYSESLKASIDLIAQELIQLLNNNENFKEDLRKIRLQCRPFCDTPMYMDLYMFFCLLKEYLAQHGEEPALRARLEEACSTIQKMVIANAVGYAIKRDVHGISIYHPHKQMDPTYIPTLFAQESCWLSYLRTCLEVA